MRAADDQPARSPQTTTPPPHPKPQPATPQTPGGRGGQRQPGPFEWWKDEGVKKELGLTEQVAREIGRIVEDREKAMAPFEAARAKALDDLDKMMREGAVDVSAIELQANRLETLRAKLSETRIVMLYRIQKKLTPEQNKKLQEIRDRRRGGGRGTGRPLM
jgi:Spy/CpxP family protein refolding chaperone